MITTQALTKHYGSLTAVDDISFAVEPGEVLGFLGPNGAGKSTTMKMITGFLTPTSGSISVCDYDVISQPLQAKRCIGYLPEGAPSYGEMTPFEFLDFVAELRGLKGAHKHKRLDQVIDQLQLHSVLYRPIENLSKGYKRRVGLAQAIVHDPKVLILDEPTDGLDPNQKHEVRSLINGMAKDKLIVISTHILEEVNAVCSRAIIISQGRVVADDTPKNLEARSRYHNAVSLYGENLQEMREVLANLSEIAAVEMDENDSRLIAFPSNGEPVFPVVSKLAHERNWRVQEVRVESGRLDEVFRAITTEAANKEAA